MTERYERLLIDSCPQRRGWLRWQLGSPLFLAAPGSGPVSSYAPAKPFPSHMSSCILCGGQTLPHHSSSCLVISCVSAKPFPLSPCLFLVILTQHNMTQHWPFIFPFPHHIVYVRAHPKVCVSVCIRMCVCFHLFSCSTARWFGISSMSKQQLQQPWHISECFFSRSLRKWSAPRLLIPLHSTVHQGDFVFTA